jgi:hypothetical protein
MGQKSKVASEAQESRSDESRAGTPTMYEKYQILGSQYSTQVTESNFYRLN